jgi:hypothetical protein
MLVKYARLMLIPGLLVLATSCNETRTATQIQMDEMDKTKALANAHLAHMVDNAMLQDMSIADHHFVGHTAELSGTGVARLDRMAPFLDAYGGVVRYETYCPDEALVRERIEHVREYLALLECDMHRIEIKQMISGGRGMSADEAIEKKAKGTAKPGPDASGGGFMIGTGQSGS